MSKPEWKDAPEWAGWLAMDFDGAWFWHEFEPVKTPHSRGVWWQQQSGGRIQGATDGHVDPAKSLEPRP